MKSGFEIYHGRVVSVSYTFKVPHITGYCKFGNICENLILAYFHNCDASGGSRISGSGVQIHQEGGSISTFYMIFHKFPHEIEVIWSQRGVQANHPNPL